MSSTKNLIEPKLYRNPIQTQSLTFSYHPNITKRTVQQRHSLERETPFCVYLGLLIYAKTRKKQLIDILFQYDLCISYNRVLEIST